MAIENYSELQSAVADWLWGRSDLATVIPTFIANAEAGFRRDPRIRRLRENLDFLVSQESTTLPDDFKALESLAHDSTTLKGEVDIVQAGDLAAWKRRHTSPGAPRVAAIIDRTSLRVAPVPDTLYRMKLSYWGTITPLSDTNTSNWLLAGHPDIYLYATLVETAPYLRDDARLGVWRSEYERRMEEFHSLTERGQWGGSLVARPSNPIG